jgi:phthiocerol/phenolphthiocerol synthesis type-I polyketide synthase E
LGGLGLASYAASNAFLDAEARRAGAAGETPWISVNWDAWDFGPRAATRGDAVTATTGRDAFRRILASGLRQVVVSTTPLEPRLRQWVRMEAIENTPARSHGNGTATNGPTGGSAMHRRPELSNPYMAPRDETERTIAEVWSHFLGVEPIGVNDKFFELGGHSLLAIQLLARLREIFDLDIPVQRIFEAPTVAELARSIERDRREAPSGDDLTPPRAGDLEQMLSLVESLSDAEVEALLNEAGAAEQIGAAHG